MGRLHDELGGAGPWEDLFVPRDAAGDGRPDGAATWSGYDRATTPPARTAAPAPSFVATIDPEVALLLVRLRRIAPMRLRRIGKDIRWMQKQAAKRGVDPSKIRYFA